MSKIYILFDTQRFYQDLDQVRRARGIEGAQLARLIGVTSARLLMETRNDNPRIDSLAPLATWACLSLDAYISVAGDSQALEEESAPGQEISEIPRKARGRPRTLVCYDFARLYADVDRVRRERGVGWYHIWRSTPRGIPHAIAQYVARCLPLSEPGVKALASWANLECEHYRLTPGGLD